MKKVQVASGPGRARALLRTRSRCSESSSRTGPDARPTALGPCWPRCGDSISEISDQYLSNLYLPGMAATSTSTTRAQLYGLNIGRAPTSPTLRTVGRHLPRSSPKTGKKKIRFPSKFIAELKEFLPRVGIPIGGR
eukprot:3043039-Rhodomonas_salina.3